MDKDCDLIELSDGKLLTNDGWTFKIHKVILARSSTYFRAMFCGMNKDNKEFTVSGVSGESLSDILSYIYSGNIHITEENIADLLVAADYLLLENLCLEVKGSIISKFTEANCLKILKAAHVISDKGTYEDCFRLTETGFELIMGCEKNGVADLPFEILETILRSRCLYVFSERTVWRVIVEWTQKDIQCRLIHLPRLLLSLAIAEVDEKLAEEILEHDLIRRNDSLLKHLIGVMKSSNTFINNVQMFSNLLCNRLSHILEPYYFRIPTNIHILCHRTKLYATYDEKFDLWNNISIDESDFFANFVRVIGHNVYIFKSNIDEDDGTPEYEGTLLSKNFDLNEMQWMPMEFWRHDITFPCILTIDHYIYVTGTRGGSYGVMVYDTEINSWFEGSSLSEIRLGRAVSIEKKIYVVGKKQNRVKLLMYVFDSASEQWSSLPSPNRNRRVKYALVECRQKIYLIGGTKKDEDIDKAEVYDPVTNIWKELPDIPYSYASIRAKVLNDDIFLYEASVDPHTRKMFRWNFEEECWEQLEESSDIIRFLPYYTFCTTDDPETIKIITNKTKQTSRFPFIEPFEIKQMIY